MKKIKISSAVLILVSIVMMAGFMLQNPFVISNKFLDGNNIIAWNSNDGLLNRNINGNSGFCWYSDSKPLNYATALWVSGITGNDTLMSVADFWSKEYLPGYINGKGEPQGSDDPDFRVFKIEKGDTLSEDYLNWPVLQGAYLDSNKKPFLPGTQTLFYSMTDGYPESHTRSAPMKNQVQVTSWCYNTVSDPVISNTVFTEFKIINKNSSTFTNATISIWSDMCSGPVIATGCDTVLQLGYAYMDSTDNFYGNDPPAFGFILLQRPLIHTGNVNDTVRTYIPGKNRRTRTGFKEVNMTSFNMYQNSSFNYEKPETATEIFRGMHGLFSNGNPWIVPGTSQVTKFPFSGDPGSGTGWVQWNTINYGNRRLLMNMNIPSFASGDTQSVIIAQYVSRGNSNLNSVTRFKSDAIHIKNIFDSDFTTVSINNNSTVNEPGVFRLNQNYPNPFNPSTLISYELSKRSYVSVKIYDIGGRLISEPVSEVKNVGHHEYRFDGSNLSSGVYFFTITAGNQKQTIKMLLQK